MHMHWLIAERCVRRRIPVARVDFDLIEPLTALREPWRILLAFAAQLDVQLTGKPFQELLAELRPQLARLERGPLAAVSEVPDASLDLDVRTRVLSVLATSTKPIVLILDTLEVALESDDAAAETERLRPLIELLDELHESVPLARLVLAGRYDLAQRINGLPDALAGGITLELHGFSPVEARAYLTKRRGLIDPALIDAAIEKAGGVPFKLALIADVIDQRPDLSAVEISGYADADLLYLIERVIERLDNRQLRWLLRYGVIPRRLRREFVEAVMLPHLAGAMAGESTDDQIANDALPGSDERNGPFPTMREPIEVDALWRELERYAGTASWVSMPDSDGALVFHPDVLRPMRRLLSRQRIFGVLHNEAAEYMEARAAADPGRWAAWMREALYHHLQLEQGGAARFWRRALARAREVGGPTARAALADELLQNPPSVGLRIEAYYERALATVERAIETGAPDHDPAWAHAETDIAAVERLQRDWSRPLISIERVALVRGPLALRTGRNAEALVALQAGLRIATGADRIRLHVAAAEARRRLGEPGVDDELRHALAAATEHGARDTVIRRLRARLAAEAEARGKVRAALEECGEADSEDLALARGRLALRVADYEGALRHARALPTGDTAGLKARALLALWRPVEALSAAEATVAIAHERGDLDAIARAQLQRGGALARLLEAPAALRAFELARTAATGTGSAKVVCQAALDAARVQLRTLGAIRDAGLMLDQAERALPGAGAELGVRVRVLRAEWLARTATGPEALALIDGALRDAAASPWWRIDAALAALSIDGRSQLDTLCSALYEIDDRGARLVALERLRACPRLTGSPALLDELRASVELDEGGYLITTAIELARVVGDDARARTLLDSARRALAAGRLPPFVLQQLLAAGDRVGDAWTLDEEAEHLRAFLGEYSGFGMLAADVLYRHGRHQVLAGHEDRGRELIEQALRRLRRVGAPTMAEARMHEALSTLVKPQESVTEHRAHAATVYQQLGDRRRLALAGGQASIQAAKPPTAPHCELRVLGGWIESVWHAGVRQRPARMPAQRLLGPVTPAGSRAWYSSVGQDLLAPGALAALGELLVPWPGTDAQGDLHLKTFDEGLVALPWELARSQDGRRLVGRSVRGMVRLGPEYRPDEIVRAVQAALGLRVDGVYGPLTRRRVSDVQRSAGFAVSGQLDTATILATRRSAVAPPRGVLVIRASATTADQRARGWMARGVRLDDLYAQWADAGAIEDPSLKRLEQAFEARGPSIVHLNAPLAATPSGVAVDFASSAPSATVRRNEEPLMLHALTLDRLLRRASEQGPRPLVIVDLPSTPNPGEAMRQLLMRNAFAAELVTLGGGVAIGATAGTDAQVRLAVLRGLSDALGDGESVANAAFAARERGRLQDPDEPFHAGLALFTGDPQLRLLS